MPCSCIWFIPAWNEQSFAKTFPLTFYPFLAVLNQLSNITYSTSISHCWQACLSLSIADVCYSTPVQTNSIIISDKHVSCWRQILLVLVRMCSTLEMNTSLVETNSLNTPARTSATHTQLATGDFQTKLMSGWLLMTISREVYLSMTMIGTDYQWLSVSSSWDDW